MKKRKGNVTQNMEFPHAITGSEMRDFYRKKTLEEEKIEEEKSMKKVLAAEKAEKKLQDETKKKLVWTVKCPLYKHYYWFLMCP